MSGETQVRRRKDKRKKKDSVSDDGTCDEDVKEHTETGSSCLTVLVFLLLLAGISVLGGLIYIQSTGVKHVDAPIAAAPVLETVVETVVETVEQVSAPDDTGAEQEAGPPDDRPPQGEDEIAEEYEVAAAAAPGPQEGDAHLVSPPDRGPDVSPPQTEGGAAGSPPPKPAVVEEVLEQEVAMPRVQQTPVVEQAGGVAGVPVVDPVPNKNRAPGVPATEQKMVEQDKESVSNKPADKVMASGKPAEEKPVEKPTEKVQPGKPAQQARPAAKPVELEAVKEVEQKGKPDAKHGEKPKPSQQTAEKDRPAGKPLDLGKPTEEPIEKVKPVEKLVEKVKQTEKPVEKVKSIEESAQQVKSTEKHAEKVKPAEKPADKVKPAEKPAEKVKPTEKPTVKVKLTGKHAEKVKPADKPAEKINPAEKPAEKVKPAEKPAVKVKPAEKPTEKVKPADKPAEKVQQVEKVQSSETLKPVEKAKPSEKVNQAEQPVKHAKPTGKPIEKEKDTAKPVEKLKPAEKPVEKVKPTEGVGKVKPSERSGDAAKPMGRPSGASSASGKPTEKPVKVPAAPSHQPTKSDTHQHAKQYKKSADQAAASGADQPQPADAAYDKADITGAPDWDIRHELDAADGVLDTDPAAGLSAFGAILSGRPLSPRALWGRARALNAQAMAERNNNMLDKAIAAFKAVLALDVDEPLPLQLFRRVAETCVQQMHFRGLADKAARVQQRLIQKFPDDYMLRNHLATVFMTYGQNSAAEEVLQEVLRLWPENGYAKVHLGFLRSTQQRHADAALLLQQGLDSDEPGVHDGRFYYHLGDAYYRLGERAKAHQTYEEGARRGLLLSAQQRSLYNVNRLTARPYWTPEQTGSMQLISALEASWETVRSEMQALLASDRPEDGFKNEAEQLSRHGDWKQFTLFQRGRRDQYACAKLPLTCALIEQYPEAAGCRRGQVKFSMLSPGTRIWPHAGPTNCRLRMHLGLVVPPGTGIRVADTNSTWQEGKVMVIDDSFEHEVWNDGERARFILIVDIWHPELTAEERHALPAI